MLKKILFVILMPASAAVVVSCNGNARLAAGIKQDAPVPVTVEKPGAASAREIHASGQVESKQTADITTRIMGKITSIAVKIGDAVRRGQLLATISADDVRARKEQANAMIAEAEVAFAAAQKDYDRYTALYRQQSATQKEVDNITLQYRAAAARVEAAKQARNEADANMAYSRLTSPFDGVVTRKLAEAGTIASPGVPILTVEQNGILQVAATVAETDISRIQVGDAALLGLGSADKRMTGRIIEINPSSQFSGGQYAIKISIPGADKKQVYAGMFVNVLIPQKAAIAGKGNEYPAVPLSAIVHRDDLSGIYTVGENSRALLRWVRLGRVSGDRVEVLSGLSRDENFIAAADGRLYNGAPIAIKNVH